jgi:hypothetical protein
MMALSLTAIIRLCLTSPQEATGSALLALLPLIGLINITVEIALGITTRRRRRPHLPEDTSAQG